MTVVATGPAVRGTNLPVQVVLPVAMPNLTVGLPSGDGGIGAGICPPPLRGECLDITGDVDVQFGLTDAGGVAPFTVFVEPDHPTDTLALQAWVPVPSGVWYHSAPVELTVVDPPADCDGVPAGGTQQRVRYPLSEPDGACIPETQTRTCDQGAWSSWSGTAAYPSCRTAPLRPDSPQVGAQYLTWFGLDTPSGDCTGTGWRDRPFQLDGVQSLLFGSNGCYSSNDPGTATVHADFLDQLGVDFVLFDVTNFSKVLPASANPIYQASTAATSGFAAYDAGPIQQALGRPARARVAYQLSLTCWGEQCHGVTDPADPNARREIFTWNANVADHVDAIAAAFLAAPERFQHVDGKPLLVFYVNAGSNVFALDGTPAFSGPGGLVPTTADFDPVLDVDGADVRLRDFFSVRFSVVAANDFDYAPFSTDLWPFQCSGTACNHDEAGYVSLYSTASGQRSLTLFDGFLANAATKDFVILRNWNEFSSTDEFQGSAYTLEPNTVLHTVDTTPGNQDPFWYYNAVKHRLSGLVDHRVTAQHSDKCLDVAGASPAEGEPLQQYDCLGRSQRNQVWHLVRRGGDDYELVAAHSDQCATVEGLDNGAIVVQRPCVASPQQLWRVVDVGGGAFNLRSLHSDRCLDVTAADTSNGTPLQQYDCLGGANQAWAIDPY
jgi:hypothetical protein